MSYVWHGHLIKGVRASASVGHNSCFASPPQKRGPNKEGHLFFLSFLLSFWTVSLTEGDGGGGDENEKQEEEKVGGSPPRRRRQRRSRWWCCFPHCPLSPLFLARQTRGKYPPLRGQKCPPLRGQSLSFEHIKNTGILCERPFQCLFIFSTSSAENGNFSQRVLSFLGRVFSLKGGHELFNYINQDFKIFWEYAMLESR